jgi:hypothetical protein
MPPEGDSSTADAGAAKADTTKTERPTHRIRRVIVNVPGALPEAPASGAGGGRSTARLERGGGLDDNGAKGRVRRLGLDALLTAPSVSVCVSMSRICSDRRSD